MTYLRSISITDWEFRAILVTIAVALLVASFVLLRHWWTRWAARLVTLIVGVAFVGATINAHFGYFPTVGALLGRNAADQISSSGFRRLENSIVRTVTGHFHSRSALLPSGKLPKRGVVVSFVIPPTVSHFKPRTGEVYLPPIWFEHPHPHLPVIELLHGSPGSPADWTRASFADLTADKYAQAHNGFGPILVMPDVNGGWLRDSECVNGPRGNAEEYLTVDVRHAVVRAFGARADGGSWAVAGLSEGGSCALQMALRHPDMFAAVGDFSGDDHPWVGGGLSQLFWGSTHARLVAAEHSYDPRVLLERWHRSSEPFLIFASGRSDRLLPKMLHLMAEAQRHHFDAVLHTAGGGHDFYFWGKSFAFALPIMMHFLEYRRPVHLRATPKSRAIAHEPCATCPR
jgi:S-formylglutathione hydrolase FrmB